MKFYDRQDELEKLASFENLANQNLFTVDSTAASY